MNDRGALRLALRCGRHDVHDNEWRNIAAFRWRQQPFCRIKHHFQPIWPYFPAPVPPHSPVCLRPGAVMTGA
jgi:hypothetical protein